MINRKLVLIIFLCLFSGDVFAASNDKDITIVIDPGHGEIGTGASGNFEDKVIHEEVINLKIAMFLKKILEEEYEGINVILTRDEDYDVDLEERTEIAVESKAAALISIHNNAYGENFEYDHGATVLAARGQYRKELAEEEQNLGVSILHELSLLGLEDQGLLLRDSVNGETYPNGEVADYYAIIRNGIKNNLLSIIVEHAFLDNSTDYENYLATDEKLKTLAEADARGIARYFGLRSKETGELIAPLVNIEEPIYYLKDDQPEHNELSKKVFFEKTSTESKKESSTKDQESLTTELSSQSSRHSKQLDQKSDQKSASRGIRKAFRWVIRGFFVFIVLMILVGFIRNKRTKK